MAWNCLRSPSHLRQWQGLPDWDGSLAPRPRPCVKPLHAACLQPARSCMQFTRASGRLVGWLSSLSRVELDLKRSIWPGLASQCFGNLLGGSLWGSVLGSPAHLPLYPPPGLPALVHHLLDLALLCSSGVTSGYCCHVCWCLVLHVVCPPIVRASLV